MLKNLPLCNHSSTAFSGKNESTNITQLTAEIRLFVTNCVNIPRQNNACMQQARLLSANTRSMLSENHGVNPQVKC